MWSPAAWKQISHTQRAGLIVPRWKRSQLHQSDPSQFCLFSYVFSGSYVHIRRAIVTCKLCCVMFYWQFRFICYVSVFWVITHVGVVGAFSRVCLSVCLSVCPRSNRKTAWSINTKHGTRILYISRSACIDPEIKRSKVKITRLQKPSRSHGWKWRVQLQPCAAAVGMGLHVDTTAYVF